MAFVGISYGLAQPLFGALWPEIYGLKHLGGIRSIVLAMGVLMTALGPGVTGVLIDLGVYYPNQILTMGVYCLAASGVLLFVSQKILTRQIVTSTG